MLTLGKEGRSKALLRKQQIGEGEGGHCPRLQVLRNKMATNDKRQGSTLLPGSSIDTGRDETL